MVLPFVRMMWLADVICHSGRLESALLRVDVWSDVYTPYVSNRWNGHTEYIKFTYQLLSSGLLTIRTASFICLEKQIGFHASGLSCYRSWICLTESNVSYSKASFMVLIQVLVFPPWTMLKLSMLPSWSDLMEWSYIGGEPFEYSFSNLSVKSAHAYADGHQLYMAFFITLGKPITTISSIWLHFFSGCDLCPSGTIRRFLMVSPPLKCNLNDSKTSNCIIFLCFHLGPA